MNKHFWYISVCYMCTFLLWGKAEAGHLVLLWDSYARSWTNPLRVEEKSFKFEEAFAHDQWVRNPGRGKDLHKTQCCECVIQSRNKHKSSTWWRKENNVQCLDKYDEFLCYSSSERILWVILKNEGYDQIGVLELSFW